MYNKKLCLVFVTLLVLSNVDGKKTKKSKRKPDEDYTTLQPNVVAYSTFGFNDVGSYDGFVPTSPDYANYLSGGGQESSTRLYAPAFPSASDTTGYGGSFDSNSQVGQSFGVSDNNVGESGMLQFSPHAGNIFNSPNFGNSNNQDSNSETGNANDYTRDEHNTPTYGTKINSRYKAKPENQYNNTEFNIFSNSFINITNDKYFGFEEPTQGNKPVFGESSFNYKQTNTDYVPNHPANPVADFRKPVPPDAPSALKFPKVIDFTKLNQYYPTELDTTKLTENTKSSSSYKINQPNENVFPNSFHYNSNNFVQQTKPFPEPTDVSNNDNGYETNVYHKNMFPESNTYNHPYNDEKRHEAIPKTKKKPKKPSVTDNNNNHFENWKDSSDNQGYGFSTNVSHMNFKYGVSDMKKPSHFNNDEVVPASSNAVHLPIYQYPETDYSKFKKMPEFDDEEEFPPPVKNKVKAKDYREHFKNLFTTTPASASYWGNAFKSSDFSIYRDHSNKYQQDENNDEDEVVNIPRRPSKPPFFKPAGNKYYDWPSHKTKQPKDWTKHFPDTRYKSEEDLLGLRNHDTSHPSYLPTYKQNNDIDGANEYNKLVEKWRQSYVQAKLRDYESYASEAKPLHVPVPKPYPIEVPHPVIVPVPHPYPIKVPISRPVAVPVVQELTIPIEKPVPYPVYKKVPYPVIKPVPVPIEKEVAVPVEKPYPVHIPYVRPVFHHTKPVHEEYEMEQSANEDNYMPRPSYKKPPSKKRPYPSRQRSRRPSRMTYQERSRRRWPENRRPSRPRPASHPSSYRYRDFESEDDDRRERDYVYCKRTGKC